MPIYSPVIIYTFICCNLLLSGLGVKYTYLGAALFFFLVLLLIDNKQKTTPPNCIVNHIFILFLIIHGIISFYYEGVESLRNPLLFIWPIAFWNVYFSKRSQMPNRVLKHYFYIAGTIALAGIIQYFYSDSLFGLIPSVEQVPPNTLNTLNTAPGPPRLSYFRTSSITGSPQIYGTIVFLSGVLFRETSPKTIFNKIFFLFLVSASLFSGNKLVILLICIYSVYVLRYNRKLIPIFLGVLLAIIIINISPLQKPLKTIRLSRLILVKEAIFQEKRDSRIDRYKAVIQDTPFLTGKGAGYYDVNKLYNYPSIESQFFKFYAEYGAIGMLLFQAMFLLPLWKTFASNNPIWIVIFLSYIAGWAVQLIESPFFFYFWGIIIHAQRTHSLYPKVRTHSNYTTESGNHPIFNSR
ncbi:hypothetical protein [Halodesulfovibrio aestuarii]|uniref:O-antigen ligase domain-containing protein n=1 Tax=Halodesulfovibrio aestuarii TaxID=126333 RepID=A0ABV4JZT8_9BACT